MSMSYSFNNYSTEPVRANETQSSSYVISSSGSTKVISLADNRKKPLLEEVDAELKKLKNQFSTLKAGTEMTQPRVITAQESPNRSVQNISVIRQPNVQQESPQRNSSFSAMEQPKNNYINGRVMEIFEVKKNIGTGSGNSVTPLKPSTAIETRSTATHLNAYQDNAPTVLPFREATTRQMDMPNKMTDTRQTVKMDAYMFGPTSGQVNRSAVISSSVETMKPEMKPVEMPKPLTTLTPTYGRVEYNSYKPTNIEPTYKPLESYVPQKVETMAQKPVEPQQTKSPLVEPLIFKPTTGRVSPALSPRDPVAKPSPSMSPRYEQTKIDMCKYDTKPATATYEQSPSRQNNFSYEPSSLPSAIRYQSKKERITYDDTRSQSVDRNQEPKKQSSQYFDFETKSSYTATNNARIERDESIRRNEAKKLAEYEEKLTLLTKNIDTVNKENAVLKHEITKLTAELSSIDNMKKEMIELNLMLGEKDLVIRDLMQKNDEAEFQLRRVHERIEQVRRTNSNSNHVTISDQSAFNDALKIHLEENLRIKDKLSQKDEEIDRLRDQIQALRGESDHYRHQLDIQKLKHMSEIKNLQTTFEIETQKLTNDAENLQRVVTSLDEKMKYIMKEDKRKDEFLVNYLKGKTGNPEQKDLIVSFFKQFEQLPKLTVSEIMKQEIQVQNQLKEQLNQMQRQYDESQNRYWELRKKYQGY